MMNFDTGRESSLRALGAERREERIRALADLQARIGADTARPRAAGEVNNHVHTFYSFSPYSPAMAAWKAREARLRAVGIMDHDSVAGAPEMLEACRIVGIASTVGCELRVSFAGTAFEDFRLNNPDSVGIAYVAIHGIPAQRLPETGRFLEPIRAARNERNRRMTGRLDERASALGLGRFDFDRDILPVSHAAEGGSVTERHLLYALALRIIERHGRGEGTVRFLQETAKLELPDRLRGLLSDSGNPHYPFDLLGVLKSSFLPEIFIQPGPAECLPVSRVAAFAREVCAIPAYAYLGDVSESPTGDKRAEKFEDAYLDRLIPELKRIGFRGVTYMPPRNSREQLLRLGALCREHELMEISGVDINSSRQSFRCPEILEPEFRHLLDATWALIAHEKLTSIDERYDLFGDRNPYRDLPLPERIRRYAGIGARIDPRHPDRAEEMIRSMPDEEDER